MLVQIGKEKIVRAYRIRAQGDGTEFLFDHLIDMQKKTQRIFIGGLPVRVFRDVALHPLYMGSPYANVMPEYVARNLDTFLGYAVRLAATSTHDLVQKRENLRCPPSSFNIGNNSEDLIDPTVIMSLGEDELGQAPLGLNGRPYTCGIRLTFPGENSLENYPIYGQSFDAFLWGVKKHMESSRWEQPMDLSRSAAIVLQSSYESDSLAGLRDRPIASRPPSLAAVSSAAAPR